MAGLTESYAALKAGPAALREVLADMSAGLKKQRYE
jgi:hypothetical protein